jgi:hypothetical protein
MNESPQRENLNSLELAQAKKQPEVMQVMIGAQAEFAVARYQTPLLCQHIES